MRKPPIVCVLLLLAAAPVAHPAEAAPATGAGAGGKPGATLYLHAKGDVKLQTRTIRRTLEDLLSSRDKKISFKRLRRVLEPPAAARRQLKLADRKAKEARDLLNNLEVEAGIATLKEALALREKHFDELARTPTEVDRQALLLADLAMATFLAGDEQATRNAILQAFILNPKLEYDANRFPPQMKRTFDEARFLADELGTGNAQVSTTPEGAEVWANGNFVGFSPITVRGLAAGRNLITVHRPGYVTVTMPANVTGGDLAAELTVQLEPVAGAPMDALEQTTANLGPKGPAAAKLGPVAKVLGKNLLFVGTAEGLDDIITVKLFAYHAGRNTVLGKVEGTVSAVDPEPECRELVSSLLTMVTRPVSPVAPRIEDRPRRGSFWSRTTKAKWFWPVVGVAIGAVVAGTTVGVYYGTRKDEPDDRRRTLILLPAGMGAAF